MESIYLPLGLNDSPWLNLIVSGLILLAASVVSLIFYKLVAPAMMKFTKWTPTELDAKIVNTARKPLSIAILLVGIYLALTLPGHLGPTMTNLVGSITRVLGIILGISLVTSILSVTSEWYVINIGKNRKERLDIRLIPLLRRFSVAIAYGLGILIILEQIGVDISPLIAGLGLGGLAVALAIQPTLSNLFAGTYVMTEGVISPEDYIELENGVAGYVVEVGWRSVRIRTWSNNLVVIPNSRFAETIVTNYQKPSPGVNVYLVCGVSYASDLVLVERLCRQVMDDLLSNDSNAVKQFGAYFGYDNFGDSNVDFWLFMQAKDRIQSFDLRSSLVINLHKKFDEYGITINYPVRTVHLEHGREPNDLQAPGKDDPDAARQAFIKRMAQEEDERDYDDDVEDEDEDDDDVKE